MIISAWIPPTSWSQKGWSRPTKDQGNSCNFIEFWIQHHLSHQHTYLYLPLAVQSHRKNLSSLNLWGPKAKTPPSMLPMAAGRFLYKAIWLYIVSRWTDSRILGTIPANPEITIPCWRGFLHLSVIICNKHQQTICLIPVLLQGSSSLSNINQSFKYIETKNNK